MTDSAYRLAESLGQCLKAAQLQLVLAESCTGGGIAKTITDVAGSSAWFDRGFVTYSNVAKVDMLEVSPLTLEKFGAVSAQAALEMVSGALKHSCGDLALAVTGIAGPEGGSPEKPLGTVFIAWQRRGQSGGCMRQQFAGDRLAVRQQVIDSCLRQALALLSG